MKLKVIVHEAEEGGFWAEVPAIPGCATQGETFEELEANVDEAFEDALSLRVQPTMLKIGTACGKEMYVNKPLRRENGVRSARHGPRRLRGLLLLD